MTITVYSTPTCPWCKKLKEYLKEKKVSFKDLDVSTNEKAKNEMVEKSNQMGVPVSDINGTVIVGFNIEKINNALKN
jgi:glutaredoxin-like YruB-family protein